MVIGTALAANADFIVTGDHGLLSVVRYEGVQIVSATVVLAMLGLS
jgi:predicted nucleic acid-binding protein